MHVIKNVDDVALVPVGQRAGADQGDPQLRMFSVSGLVEGSVGLWECQPGGWPVANRQDTEVAFILSGHATITDEQSGHRHNLTSGDIVILPRGWSGRWDVREAVRKAFVIY